MESARIVSLRLLGCGILKVLRHQGLGNESGRGCRPGQSRESREQGCSWAYVFMSLAAYSMPAGRGKLS